ncbi:hypothetical protein MMC11_002293 [Xylographa trunciseda]|nr:hypothetical protein [Xylographa trunciseda]
MGSKDPSRGASVASSEASLIDPAIVARILPKKDSFVGKVRIKKTVPKLKVENNDENRRSGSPESPLVNDIDPDLRATFPTGRPMEDKAELIQCKHCKKPMLKAVAASHIQMCLQKKQDRAQRKKEQKEVARRAREARDKGKDEDGDVGMEDTVTVGSIGGGDGAEDADGDKIAKIGKKSAVNGNGADKSKKRKADTEGDKEPKKKKTKKEIEAAKPKVPKPKGPVDVEKQCGVLLPNGAHCARSLTCKSHAMGAKRAVPGRSLPYDMLLAAYQKKNQAKQQRGPPIRIEPASSVTEDSDTSPRRQPMRAVHKQPAIAPRKRKAATYLAKASGPPASYAHSSDSDATISDGNSPSGFTPVKRPKLDKSDISEAAIDANAPLLDETDALGPVDSDEEMNQVMMGIARSRPQPIAQHIPVSTRKRYMNIRFKEMLRQGLSGTRTMNYGVEGAGIYGTATLAGDGGLAMSGALGGLVGGGMGSRGGGAAAGGGVGDGLEAGDLRRASVAQPSGGNGGRASIGGAGSTSSGAGIGMPARKASTASQGPATAS